ncbi:hypothetical protein BHE74_00004126 [Ensete ventricosum]|nr:hypothetical protein BHE74_00004126 [Ensete ventricosum]
MASAWRADDNNHGCDSGGEALEMKRRCRGKKVQGKNSVSRACNCDRGRREVGVGDGSGAATGSAWLGVTC